MEAEEKIFSLILQAKEIQRHAVDLHGLTAVAIENAERQSAENAALLAALATAIKTIEDIVPGIREATSETREMLAEIINTSQEVGHQFVKQIEGAKDSWIDAAQEAQKAVNSMKQDIITGKRQTSINAFMA